MYCPKFYNNNNNNIFINCNWVVIRWQYTFTHNNTQNNTNNNRTTQITNNVEECGPYPLLASFYPGICLTAEEKARKNHSQGERNFSQVNKNLSQSTVNLSQSTVTSVRLQ
jgi:hypothetical protein